MPFYYKRVHRPDSPEGRGSGKVRSASGSPSKWVDPIRGRNCPRDIPLNSLEKEVVCMDHHSAAQFSIFRSGILENSFTLFVTTVYPFDIA